MMMTMMGAHARGDRGSDTHDRDERAGHMPREHHRHDHQLVVIVGAPRHGARQRVVQDEAGLPEPRALRVPHRSTQPCIPPGSLNQECDFCRA